MKSALRTILILTFVTSCDSYSVPEYSEVSGTAVLTIKGTVYETYWGSDLSSPLPNAPVHGILHPGNRPGDEFIAMTDEEGFFTLHMEREYTITHYPGLDLEQCSAWLSVEMGVGLGLQYERHGNASVEGICGDTLNTVITAYGYQPQ